MSTFGKINELINDFLSHFSPLEAVKLLFDKLLQNIESESIIHYNKD